MSAQGPPDHAAALGARLDSLRWSTTHQGILIALGAGWLFDALEINLVGNVINPLSEHFHASTRESSFIYWVWLIGIMIGALTGGRLADRFGRRRLFLVTLLWYSSFTVLTALSPTLDTVFVLRFLTALGVGAEYAIINAAITEFMPARLRGAASAGVMSFWSLGAIASGLVAFLMLNELALPTSLSWRFGFALGGVLALLVLLLRRRVPESPRWLVAQGRFDEAEEIVARLERAAGRPASPQHEPAAPSTPHGSPVRELLRRHRGRLALGCVLDLSEAFGYYGIFAVLSIVVLKRVGYTNAEIPVFFILGNVGALLGSLLMTAFFDRLGRRGSIGLYYAAAAASVGVLAAATESGGKTATLLAFMLANACATGAWTSAYPTFTELFPTHLRAAGVGISVGVGRIGAAFGTLYLPDIADRMGAGASYTLIAGFWLVGVVAIVVWTVTGGVEGARQPLDAVSGEAAPKAAAPSPLLVRGDTGG